MRLAIGLGRAIDRTDIEGRMRPGRLRQILDYAGDAVIAFDQPDIAFLDDAAQMFGIAGREWFIAGHLLLKVTRNQLADRIEHEAHGFPPAVHPDRFFVFVAWSKAIAIWFMASSDQT